MPENKFETYADARTALVSCLEKLSVQGPGDKLMSEVGYDALKAMEDERENMIRNTQALKLGNKGKEIMVMSLLPLLKATAEVTGLSADKRREPTPADTERLRKLAEKAAMVCLASATGSLKVLQELEQAEATSEKMKEAKRSVVEGAAALLRDPEEPK